MPGVYYNEEIIRLRKIILNQLNANYYHQNITLKVKLRLLTKNLDEESEISSIFYKIFIVHSNGGRLSYTELIKICRKLDIFPGNYDRDWKYYQ